MMRFKRARSPGEIAREVSAAMPEASEEEQQAEQAARLEKLKINSLLIEQWSLDDVEADLQWCGLSGSPTKVHRVQSIVLTKEGFKEVPPTEDGVRSMIHELIVDHTWG
jgi:electron transfer flavoprotein beta subunit